MPSFERDPIHPKCILLPGMDGTGRLFDAFTTALSPEFEPRVVSYSPRVAQSYDELEDLVWSQLPPDSFCIIAESFSGPLALRVAARAPQGLRAVVLAATFVTNPVPWLSPSLASAVGALFFRIPPTAFALKRYLLGSDCPPALLTEFRDAVRSVHPSVMAARLVELLRLDVREALRRCPVPVLVFSGSDDGILLPSAVENMKALRPDITHITIKGPHLLLQRCAPTIATDIGEFLDRL